MQEGRQGCFGSLHPSGDAGRGRGREGLALLVQALITETVSKHSLAATQRGIRFSGRARTRISGLSDSTRYLPWATYSRLGDDFPPGVLGELLDVAQQWNNSGKGTHWVDCGKVYAGSKEPLREREALARGWVLLSVPFRSRKHQ